MAANVEAGKNRARALPCRQGSIQTDPLGGGLSNFNLVVNGTGTGLVGTRDLGQEVFTALQRAGSELGRIAGLSIAFIAIIADRFVITASTRIGDHLDV
jgi:hypothetical protein